MDDSAMDNLHNGWLDWERDSDGRLDGDAMALVMEGLHDGRLGNRWKSLQLTAPQWAGMNGLKVNVDGRLTMTMEMDRNRWGWTARWTVTEGDGLGSTAMDGLHQDGDTWLATAIALQGQWLIHAQNHK